MSTAEKLKREGREEGREQGRVEGRATLLAQQLAWKFGAMPPAIEARLAAASIPDLDRWAQRVLTAQSLDEVFAGS